MSGMWSSGNYFLLLFFTFPYPQLKSKESLGNHKLAAIIRTALILRFHFRTFNDMLQERKLLP